MALSEFEMYLRSVYVVAFMPRNVGTDAGTCIVHFT